jgi:hypothetical protein
MGLLDGVEMSADQHAGFFRQIGVKRHAEGLKRRVLTAFDGGDDGRGLASR